ncbi:hypothetical protein, partial [Hafnia sp.]|uniref:hypothetical protein n=1 Tax=Hafnia sp. TaxID=1873498 RepID=UPI002FCC22BB
KSLFLSFVIRPVKFFIAFSGVVSPSLRSGFTENPSSREGGGYGVFVGAVPPLAGFGANIHSWVYVSAARAFHALLAHSNDLIIS